MTTCTRTVKDNRHDTPIASISKRVSALLIDISLIQLSAPLITIPISENFLLPPSGQNTFSFIGNIEALLYLAFLKVTILFALSALYFTTFTSSGGQTPGKKIFRIRVIRASGYKIGIGRALIRYLLSILSLITILGFLSIIFDRRGQGWHDKWSGTFVIDLNAETVPGCIRA